MKVLFIMLLVIAATGHTITLERKKISVVALCTGNCMRHWYGDDLPYGVIDLWKD